MSCQEVSPPAYFFGCFLHCLYKGGWLKIFLDKAEGFKQANQLFPGLCAHAPGGNSILQVEASEQSTKSLLEHLRLLLGFFGGHRCFAIGMFSKDQYCMVLCKSQLFGGNPLLHASFHLRQTDGNTFGKCIRMAAMRFCSLNQNAIFHLSLHRDCHRTNESWLQNTAESPDQYASK